MVGENVALTKEDKDAGKELVPQQQSSFEEAHAHSWFVYTLLKRQSATDYQMSVSQHMKLPAIPHSQYFFSDSSRLRKLILSDCYADPKALGGAGR